MIQIWAHRNILVHRHAGGLEIQSYEDQSPQPVHRHAGGLEIAASEASYLTAVHRHAGGLETEGPAPF